MEEQLTPPVWVQTPYLECKHCREQTQLPLAMLQDKFLDRTRSKWGELRILFACGHCKHVDSYPPKLPKRSTLAVDDPFQPNATQDVYEINIECDGDSCYLPLSVFAVRGVGMSDAALRKEVRTWIFHDGVDCPGGFPARGQN